MRRALIVSFAVLGLLGCASRRSSGRDYGIPSCPSAAPGGLLSADWLQCWLAARHGRWRILSHESHYDVLVVQVEAADVRDADEIARRFVEGHSGMFSEILVYAKRESPPVSSRLRRVRWTREAGFEAFEF